VSVACRVGPWFPWIAGAATSFSWLQGISAWSTAIAGVPLCVLGVKRTLLGALDARVPHRLPRTKTRSSLHALGARDGEKVPYGTSLPTLGAWESPLRTFGAQVFTLWSLEDIGRPWLPWAQR
jgi:hypothetical protein